MISVPIVLPGDGDKAFAAGETCSVCGGTHSRWDESNPSHFLAELFHRMNAARQALWICGGSTAMALWRVLRSGLPGRDLVVAAPMTL